MSNARPRITLQQALKRLMDGMDDGQQGEDAPHISASVSSASPSSAAHATPSQPQPYSAAGSQQLTQASPKQSTNMQDSLPLAELHQADGDDELSSDADGAAQPQRQPPQHLASRPRRPAKRGRSRSRSSSSSVQRECSSRSRSRSTRRRIFSRASPLEAGVESSDPQHQLMQPLHLQQQEDMDEDNTAALRAMQQLHAQQQLAYLLRHGRARSEAGLRKRSSMDRQQMRALLSDMLFSEQLLEGSEGGRKTYRLADAELSPPKKAKRARLHLSNSNVALAAPQINVPEHSAPVTSSAATSAEDAPLPSVPAAPSAHPASAPLCTPFSPEQRRQQDRRSRLLIAARGIDAGVFEKMRVHSDDPYGS